MFKNIKKKICKFVLEPDGFSIHTFELSRRLTKHEFDRIKGELYALPQSKGKRVYKDDHGVYRCETFGDYGIRVRLEKYEAQRYAQYYLRLTVNPKRLLNPGGDWREIYLGILPPGKKSVEDMTKAFARLFRDTEIPNKIDDYKLSRLDLCVNIRSDKKKIFRELVRILRKLPTPEKYERKYYRCADKKAENAYNKHYLRFVCGTHELVIYDKTYQLAANDLAVSYEKLPAGVLRIEVHCRREYLRKIEKKHGIDSTQDLIERMMGESGKRIVKLFSQCFHTGEFCQPEEIERRISASRFDPVKKAAMLTLSGRMQRMQNLDKALRAMGKEGYDTKGILNAFQSLNISPIPLRKNFSAPCLPGIVELLRGVARGEVPVEYIKIKDP